MWIFFPFCHSLQQLAQPHTRTEHSLCEGHCQRTARQTTSEDFKTKAYKISHSEELVEMGSDADLDVCAKNISRIERCVTALEKLCKDLNPKKGNLRSVCVRPRPAHAMGRGRGRPGSVRVGVSIFTAGRVGVTVESLLCCAGVVICFCSFRSLLMICSNIFGGWSSSVASA